MSTPKGLETASIRKEWGIVKKAAEKKGKTLKAETAVTALLDQFEEDLGPNIEEWTKLYPKFQAMEDWRAKNINKVIVSYLKKVKDAAIPPAIAKELKDGLNAITKAMDERASVAAVLALMSGDAAEAKAKKGKPPTVIPVLEHPNLARKIMAAYPEGGEILSIEEFSVEVHITDPKVLEEFDTGDASMFQKVVDAADFGKLIKDSAVAYKDAVNKFKKNPKNAKSIEKEWNQAVDKAIEESCGRAAKEVERLTGVKSDYKKYRVKAGIKLGFAMASLVASGLAFALGPLTFGASAVVGAVAIARSAVGVAAKIKDLADEAEDVSTTLFKDISSLLKGYEEAEKASAKVGAKETSMTGLSSLVGAPVIATIKNCRAKSGLLGDKLNGLEVGAGKTSKHLTDLLDEQESASKAFKEFRKLNADQLSRTQEAALKKVEDLVDKNNGLVDKLIKEVIALNKRASSGRRIHVELDKGLAVLNTKQPVWSKVGEVIVETIISLGFAMSGDLVPAPDVFAIAKESEEVFSRIGMVIDTADSYVSEVENLVTALQA